MDYEAKCYVELLQEISIEDLFYLGNYPFYIIFDKIEKVNKFIVKHKEIIKKHVIEYNYKNKLMNYYDLSKTQARIEKGAIIREDAYIEDTSIILMGAIINTKAQIGAQTMIDMNAVIGSGAIIKNNCHIGAGAVIAGIMEPISNKPVIIEDDVLIGANATILNGVYIGRGSIIGAGSVVREDVMEYTTVAGVPAKVINHNGKWEINKELR